MPRLCAFWRLGTVWVVIALTLLGPQENAAAAELGPVVLERSALTPDRFKILGVSNGPLMERYHTAGSLQKLGSLEGIAGWLEFDLQVAASGWYTLDVLGSGNWIDYRVDPDDPVPDAMRIGFHGTSGQVTPAEARVGNLWLSAGHHVLHLERLFWTGFPKLEGVILRQATAEPGSTLDIDAASTALFRIGQCAPVTVRYGPQSRPTSVELHVVSARDSHNETRIARTLGPTNQPAIETVPVPCEKAGNYSIAFSEAGRPISPISVRPIQYEVFETRPSLDTAEHLALHPVQEIDAVERAPDYSGGGSASVVQKAGLRYRETGMASWFTYQRLPAAARALAGEPSWLAYSLGPLLPQHPYLVEVEYPDNANRSFTVSLRERSPLSYPVTFGAETGGAERTTNGTATMRIIYWPRTSDPRLVVLNAADGHAAALSHIRVSEITGPIAPRRLPPAHSEEKRQFVSWYEEGENFTSLWGAPDPSSQSVGLAADRWAAVTAYSGGTTLMPTTDIYAFTAYPSRVDSVFATESGDDRLRRLLFAAERHGLAVIPELHPRGDFLSLPYLDLPQPMPHLMVDKNGHTDFRDSNGQRIFPPHHNPIYPGNAQALVNLVGEMATRYQDSPAFEGISLRLMTWANATMNNFGTLDWGYDDYTVNQFAKETKLPIPAELLVPLKANDPLAHRRYLWIMDNAKADWIDWRCRKIAALYTRLVEPLRQARPDLRLYSTIFVWSATDDLGALRDAGIDPALLDKIPGLELIDARYTYGSPELLDAVNGNKSRFLAHPERLSELVGKAGSTDFLTSASYFETTEAVIPPVLLGFPNSTRSTWSSTAVSPAGRGSLARLAIPLAQTDAQMLGDGGNMYTFGQEELRDFLSEYVLLPRAAFRRMPVSSPRDVPGAVLWEKIGEAGEMFYMVNPTGETQSVGLSLSGNGILERVSQHTPIGLAPSGSPGRSGITIDLAPYELRVYATEGKLRLLEYSSNARAPQALVRPAQP